MKQLIRDKVRSLRILSLLVVDIVLINVSVLLSLFLRFEFSLKSLEESAFVEHYLSIAVLYTLISVIIFSICRLYRSLWEYASIDELRNIAFAVFFSNACLVLICKLLGVYLPRSLPILNFLILMLAVAAFRFTYRAARRVRNQMQVEQRPTMLIGAGAGGSLVLRDLKDSDRSQNKVVCIIDDDPKKQGTFLMGIKVVGTRESIPAMVQKYGIKDNDIVDVEIQNSKPTRYYNVQVRVHKDFNTEMHIDTDDANSAGIKNGSIVKIIKK